MTTLKVGIASYQDMKARTMAVARGEHRIAPDEPKVWFTSTESFAKVLSAGNRDLLRVIVEQAPAWVRGHRACDDRRGTCNPLI
jgi:predicted transcriptional regulator